MDFLASLHVEDLPEQQTRVTHLMQLHGDTEFTGKVGLDCCGTCGVDLSGNHKVSCSNCQRILYCSHECLQKDANELPTTTTTIEQQQQQEEEQAMGHSSIICSLLALCNEDEQQLTSAAKDRVQSELESYPATLANVLLQGGPCYQQVWNKLQTHTTDSTNPHKKLIIHVIGASTDSEFWGPELFDDNPENTTTATDETPINEACLDAYAEALTELAETHKLDVIELLFVGPDCPRTNLDTTRSMPPNMNNNNHPPKSSSSKERPPFVGTLMIQSHRLAYEEYRKQDNVSIPDICVFFNPGFTVPDYQWNETLRILKGTPFLSTTNTELEGIADCQYLLDQDRMQSLPDGLAEIFGLYSGPDDDKDNGQDEDHPSSSSFFSVNPFCGNRVRQSGTMANDLYVKNRWMLGGVLDSFDPNVGTASATSKRQKMGNRKQDNPALI